MGIEQPPLLRCHHAQVIQDGGARPLEVRLGQQPLRFDQVLFRERFGGILHQLRRRFLILQAALMDLRTGVARLGHDGRHRTNQRE